MRKIRDILRLRHENGLGYGEIGKSVGLSKTAVGECVRRAARAGVSWPLPDEMDDGVLEERLYPSTPGSALASILPDWVEIHTELKRKGVARQLLWEEYREKYPEGLGYSQFCELYRQWTKEQRISMRQIHKAGERVFVDYAGQTVDIIDPKTGQTRQAQIFVACWGASC